MGCVSLTMILILYWMDINIRIAKVQSVTFKFIVCYITPHDASSVSEAVGTEFLYTLNNSRLSWYQRKFYDDNGFLLIRRLVDDDVLDACSRRFVDICEGRVPKGNMILMKDISLINTGVTGEFLYNKVQDIVWDEVMTKYIFLPKLANALVVLSSTAEDGEIEVQILVA
uniref:Uncharacterized protein n=1 Tax=Timema douglasi TaxID=61478 RepID=A0A7R8VVN9_TIMDO|nr:unnamed protein product [Timema douglasi]